MQYCKTQDGTLIFSANGYPCVVSSNHLFYRTIENMISGATVINEANLLDYVNFLDAFEFHKIKLNCQQEYTVVTVNERELRDGWELLEAGTAMGNIVLASLDYKILERE